jgi:anti-sigma regulatory factor (Ser/Thr protein kinase)
MPRQAWVWGRRTTLLPVAVAFWSLIALMNATQMYIGLRGEGLPFANGLTPFLKWQEPLWLVWALLTPVVGWLAARYPLRVAAFPILVHLLAGLACALVRSAAGEFITMHLAPFPSGQDPRTYLERLAGRLTSTLNIELLVYWGLVTVFHAFDFYAKYRDREIAATRLERQLVSAQLETLRLQLDPHFLFNALHSIATLIRERENEPAVKMLTDLSQLLRQSLNTSGRQKVPLSGELDILRHYIDIQETRFPDRLHVALQVERDVEQALVPTLILQPLVENAIRHGIARLDRPGHVTIAAHRADERLRLEVSDDGPGLDTPSREAGAGVGLDNTRARLAGLYGAAQSFALQNRAGGGVTASITLPLEVEGTP